MSTSELKTPQTHPDHEIIGSLFYPGLRRGIYYCESFDPRYGGFWMSSILNPEEKTNVSLSAIGKTFHDVKAVRPSWLEDSGVYWGVPASEDPEVLIEVLKLSGTAAKACPYTTALFYREEDARRYSRTVRRRLLETA